MGPRKSGSLEDALLFLIFFLCASLYFAYSLGFGMSGDQVWRQADVYAHIIGLSRDGALAPFETFDGQIAVFDLPLYPALVAALVQVTGLDPLDAARVVNLPCFAVVLWAGGRIAATIRPLSQTPFYFLLCISPPFLHYFSSPIPDTLALSAAAAAFTLLLAPPKGRWGFPVALFLLAVSALIKSPIPFVFMVMFIAWCALVPRPPARPEHGDPLRIGIICTVALAAAVLAEFARMGLMALLGSEDRSSTLNWRWYFGTWEDRTAMIWVARERFADVFPGWRWHYLVILAYLAYAIVEGWRGVLIGLAFGLATVSGWLVFTRLYLVHDYYQLPGHFLMLCLLAAAITSIARRVLHVIGQTEVAWRDARRPDLAAGLTLAALVPLTIASIDWQFPRRDEALFRAIRYLTADSEAVAFVSDGASGPSFGARLERVYHALDHESFETQCAASLNRFDAVVSHGPSRCLEDHRSRAAVYVRDTVYVLWVRERPVSGFVAPPW